MAHTVSSILSDETLNRIMAIESRGKLKAKAPTSSALGLFQFLDGTWIATAKKHRPDLCQGRSQQQLLALRVDGTVCIELGARFTEDNAEGIGHGFTDGDLYLAHFLGLGAARKFFRAAPGASAEALAGTKAVNANPTILRGKTAGQVRAWAQNSMTHRWDQAGRVDWVSQYYDSKSPLADVSFKDHEVDPDHDAPVKQEESFDIGNSLDDLPETPPAHVEPAEPAAAPDVTFIDTAKSAFKSKIAWLAGLLGFGGAGSSVANDQSLQSRLFELVQKPSFLFMLLAVGAAGAIIYFYWRDHGKGAVK